MTTDPDTLSITRSFKASRDRLFTLFGTFEAMKQWFGPPGCDVQSGSVDFRVGGSYQMRMLTPHGEAIAGGEYRQITPPDKIVFTWKWLDDEDWANVESVVSIEFVAKGESTELRLTQVGFPSAESCGRHQHGWDGSLDQMEALFSV